LCVAALQQQRGIDEEVVHKLLFVGPCTDRVPHRKSYDFLDLSHAVESFLNGMPAASIYGLLTDRVGEKSVAIGFVQVAR
jgi:hypothetical protein